MLRALRNSYMPSMTLASIGAVQTSIPILLQPDNYHAIFLAQHGVPEDARIVHIDFSQSTGGLSPIRILRPASSLPPDYPRYIEVYSLPIAHDPEETHATIWVTWIDQQINSSYRQYLVDAFEFFTEGRYEKAIIPANVAVEFTLNRVMSSFLSKSASKQDVDQFLQDSATYGHQLNILLPTIASLIAIPKIPSQIRGGLNRLRKLRNDFAHRGNSDKPVSKEDITLCLCSAWFGYHYLELITPLLNR